MKKVSKDNVWVVKNMISQIIRDANEAMVAMNRGDYKNADLALANVTADAEFAITKLA